MSANPYNVTHGVDFVKEFSSPHIDFASIHMYSDQWCQGHSEKECTEWSLKWVSAHIEACSKYLGGKPLVLQEFGKKPAGAARTELFSQVCPCINTYLVGLAADVISVMPILQQQRYLLTCPGVPHERFNSATTIHGWFVVLQMSSLLRQSCSSRGVFQGALVWMVAHESYPDYDGYTVYANGCPDTAVAGQCVQPVVEDKQSVDVLRQLCRDIAGIAPS